jgi:very-short-patch-repair endonuclease
MVARHPGRRGTRALDTIVAARRIGRQRTRTDLEAAFLALLDADGLPRPETNRRTGPGEVDAVWPEQRLIVELDGFAAHGTRRAFENDRARDRELVTEGWRVLRITSRRLETDGPTIARQLRALLDTPPRAWDVFDQRGTPTRSSPSTGMATTNTAARYRRAASPDHRPAGARPARAGSA